MPSRRALLYMPGDDWKKITKALGADLAFRPLAQTRPAEHEWKAGLSAEREAELLMLLKEFKQEE